MKFWSRRGAVAWLLWPASLLFAAVVAVRRVLYRAGMLPSEHPGIPVIVVGNITVGGTGKTPLVIWIAELLARSGWTPGVVSRGYKGRSEAPRAATIASDPADVGDEPVLIARRAGCPVWVGADRVQAAAGLRRAEAKVDVLISDDGLQHYRLRRDVEIAVLGSLGNGFLLPAGPMREPRSRLRTVDKVLEKVQLEGGTVHRMSDARDRQPLAAFAGKRVHAVAGIGDPERFFRHLADAGLQLVPHAFADHYAFRPRDLEFGDDAPVMMTEKDAVKLRGAPRANWWVLPVTAKLDPAFGTWLLGRLDEWRRSKAA